MRKIARRAKKYGGFVTLDVKMHLTRMSNRSLLVSSMRLPSTYEKLQQSIKVWYVTYEKPIIHNILVGGFKASF